MKPAVSVALFLLLAPAALAQTVKVPPKLEGPAYRLLSLAVESDGKATRWIASDGLDVFREFDPDPKVIRLRLIAYQDGLYKIHFVTAKGDALSEFATTAVVIGKAPDPGPGPKPPEPKPDPVEPTDPLFAKLKAAWLTEADPKKGEYRKALAEVWAAAAKEAQNSAYTTYGAWLQAVRNVSAKMLPATALTNVRRAIADYLNAAVTTDGEAAMTPDLRVLAATEAARVARMLEALK